MELTKSNQTFTKLKDRELKRVARFIENEVGIQLPASKHTLVEGRLRKRMRKLGFSDFKTYLDHTLDSPEGDHEKLHMIDVITTNKTSFFRESEHFDYLANHALPVMEQNRKRDGRRGLDLWSAGCSTGEEPYTLSMVLHETASVLTGLNFNILATDISPNCLQIARNAIYTERQITSVPLPLRQKYFLKSRNSDDELVQMGPQLRSSISFDRLNLMDKDYRLKNKMDAIFCRNVMIYFNNQIREELVARFEEQLVPGGYLFVGHSESLNGINTELKQVAPMVYKRL